MTFAQIHTNKSMNKHKYTQINHTHTLGHEQAQINTRGKHHPQTSSSCKGKHMQMHVNRGHQLKQLIRLFSRSPWPSGCSVPGIPGHSLKSSWRSVCNIPVFQLMVHTRFCGEKKTYSATNLSAGVPGVLRARQKEDTMEPAHRTRGGWRVTAFLRISLAGRWRGWAMGYSQQTLTH